MKNEDRPAFPVDEETTDRIDEGITIYSGLTNLEAFTKAAMTGLLANPELTPEKMRVNDSYFTHVIGMMAAEQARETLNALAALEKADE